MREAHKPAAVVFAAVAAMFDVLDEFAQLDDFIVCPGQRGNLEDVGRRAGEDVESARTKREHQGLRAGVGFRRFSPEIVGPSEGVNTHHGDVALRLAWRGGAHTEAETLRQAADALYPLAGPGWGAPRAGWSEGSAEPELAPAAHGARVRYGAVDLDPGDLRIGGGGEGGCEGGKPCADRRGGGGVGAHRHKYTGARRI